MRKHFGFAKTAYIMVLVMMLLSMSACATFDSFKDEFFGSGDKSDTVKIGVFEPMTGEDKKEAAKEIAGIELANNLYPTVDGKKVELVYEDNRSSIAGVETSIKELIGKEPVVILGSYGDANTLAASKYISKAKIPAIAITNTNPIITATSDYYFRVCIINTYQGDALAYYAYEAMKADKACIMVQEGDAESASIAQRFMTKFQELTGEDDCIAVNTEYVSGEISYEDQLKEIKKSKAKVVLLPGGEDDAETILEEANDMDIDATFLGTSNWDSKKMAKNIGPEAASKAIYVRVSDSEAAQLNSKTYMDFQTIYESKYGEGEITDNAIALGFDAYLIAIEAIKKAGADNGGKAICDAIRDIHDFNGATGKISFNAKGDPRKMVTVYTIDVVTGGDIPMYTIDVNGKVKEIN